MSKAYQKLSAVILLSLWLLAAPAAFAQGCALCYTTAAAQDAKAARALDLAILVLLAPTLLLFGGVFFLAFRRRNADAEAAAAGDAEGPFLINEAEPLEHFPPPPENPRGEDSSQIHL